ncbi:MAG: hypothetical protein R2854_28600 [Caldilineaceae bacterium]
MGRPSQSGSVGVSGPPFGGEHHALILTWRNDHAGSAAQLRQWCTRCAKVGVLELTLARLDEDDVAALVANALGHRARTGGAPLRRVRGQSLLCDRIPCPRPARRN